jgi:hypothetical protein
MVNQEQLKSQSKNLIENSKRLGLEINTEKIEYIVVQRKGPINIQNKWLEVDHRFRRAQQFKYLGVILTQQNDVYSEVKVRIQAGNKCYFSLAKLLRSRLFFTNLKIQLYRTLIKPIVTYESEK